MYRTLYGLWHILDIAFKTYFHFFHKRLEAANKPSRNGMVDMVFLDQVTNENNAELEMDKKVC